MKFFSFHSSFKFNVQMKSSLASVIFLSLVGSSVAGFLPLGLGDTLNEVVSGAINQVVKLSTRIFHEALYPILLLIPDFYKVFPPSMDPEEAGLSCRGGVSYIYSTLNVPLDDDLIEDWVYNIKRFAANGFSSEAFVLCFSAMFGEFLTYENQMSLSAVPGLASSYVDALLEMLGLDEEEKMRDIVMVSPYHAALAKANAKFLQSVNPTITKDELDGVFKAFFEELDRHVN